MRILTIFLQRRLLRPLHRLRSRDLDHLAGIAFLLFEPIFQGRAICAERIKAQLDDEIFDRMIHVEDEVEDSIPFI